MESLARSFVLNKDQPIDSITEEMIVAFEQDGVVMLRDALSPPGRNLHETRARNCIIKLDTLGHVGLARTTVKYGVVQCRSSSAWAR